MAGSKKVERKQQILQALAAMLENEPGGKITTAKLATQVGVSEAALYRHFPSKARMFEGLIEFTEDAIFSRVNSISKEHNNLSLQCQQILALLLTFASRNAGICRLLTGDALAGENERLRDRMNQFFNRLETHLKQLFKHHELANTQKFVPDAATRANLMMAVVEGRVQQFVRTNFVQSPLANWDQQWQLLQGLCE